jgi:hypothetical protein
MTDLKKFEEPASGSGHLFFQSTLKPFNWRPIDEWINGSASLSTTTLVRFSSPLQFPVAEAMVTYKEEKSTGDESSQVFLPFLSDVRVGSDVTSGGGTRCSKTGPTVIAVAKDSEIFYFHGQKYIFSKLSSITLKYFPYQRVFSNNTRIYDSYIRISVTRQFSSPLFII